MTTAAIATASGTAARTSWRAPAARFCGCVRGGDRIDGGGGADEEELRAADVGERVSRCS